jgi:hypothetical protein
VILVMITKMSLIESQIKGLMQPWPNNVTDWVDARCSWSQRRVEGAKRDQGQSGSSRHVEKVQ